MAFGPGTAELLAQFFTDTFLGIHLVTLWMSLWTQLFHGSSRGRRIRAILLIVTIIMGMLGVVSAALGVSLNVSAWQTGNDTNYLNLPWPYKLIDVNIVVQALLGDVTWIYRCWIVYEQRWTAVICSVVIWVACLVVSVLMVLKAGSSHRPDGINDVSLTPYIVTPLVLTVLLNLLTTSLIVYRIWNISRGIRVRMATEQKLTYAMRIIVESGSIYTLSAIFLLVSCAMRSNVDYIAGHCFIQLIGISFNLVIIRQSSADQHHRSSPSACSISFGDAVDLAAEIPIGDMPAAHFRESRYVAINKDLPPDYRDSRTGLPRDNSSEMQRYQSPY